MHGTWCPTFPNAKYIISKKEYAHSAARGQEQEQDCLPLDDRKQRIVVDGSGGQGIAFFGWEVRDASALDEVAAKLEAHGVKVQRGSPALAGERFVKDLIVCSDPNGNRVELFHGAEVTSEPFKPGRSISGFRTGPLGIGHAVLNVDNEGTMQKLLPFYQDVLGFRTTDMEEGRVATTLGRHTSDFITSFYTWTPSGFMVEYGWGARAIDVDNWKAYERKDGPSLWGHERNWLPESAREKARSMRMGLAGKGVRQPLQVIEGNYEVSEGVCPWWDAMTKQKRPA
jgi:catechol 2,3-dioxygenase-like lactoylglutathione lyase family enzyme